MSCTSRAGLALLALAPFFAALVRASPEGQCLGGTPMESVKTFLGMELDYDVSSQICCNNHRFAEAWGYLAAPEVDLFGKLDPSGETVFYDSVCGIPLFVAPRGRTFEEFKEESIAHGWPSFRPEELITDNVIIHPAGRMESKCFTHLGHNLPTGGVDRYCIDLVCIAGAPLTTTTAGNFPAGADFGNQPDDGILSPAEFQTEEYTSTAPQWSGRNSKSRACKALVGVAAALAVVGIVVFFWRKQRQATVAVPDEVESLEIGVVKPA